MAVLKLKLPPRHQVSTDSQRGLISYKQLHIVTNSFDRIQRYYESSFDNGLNRFNFLYLINKETNNTEFMPQSLKYTKHQQVNYQPIDDSTEKIAKMVVDAAYTVHNNLGPGLLEKVYEICFCHELGKRGLQYLRQVNIPIVYDGLTFNEGLRLDVIIEDSVICELKALETVHPVWEAQLLSHLKLTDKRLGFLINFNVPRIKDGIRRFVN